MPFLLAFLKKMWPTMALIKEKNTDSLVCVIDARRELQANFRNSLSRHRILTTKVIGHKKKPNPNLVFEPEYSSILTK